MCCPGTATLLTDSVSSTGGVVRDIFCAFFNLELEICSNQCNVLTLAE